MQRRRLMGGVINSEHSDSIGFKLHAVMLCVCDYRIYSSKRHNVTVRHAWPLSLAPNCNPYCDTYTDVLRTIPDGAGIAIAEADHCAGGGGAIRDAHHRHYGSIKEPRGGGSGEGGGGLVVERGK